MIWWDKMKMQRAVWTTQAWRQRDTYTTN